MTHLSRWFLPGFAVLTCIAVLAVGWRDIDGASARSDLALPELEVVSGARAGLMVDLIAAEGEIDAAGLAEVSASVVGRVERGTAGPDARILHQWPAPYLRARIRGGTLFVAFDDAHNRYRIALDEADEFEVLITRPGRKMLRVTGLDPAPLEIRIDRISESISAPAALPRVLVPRAADALPPPEPRPRQIEFIGDSDSVGYGNLSPSRDCAGDAVLALTDTQAAFGPRVARRLDADYRIMAHSGLGVVRNYGAITGEETFVDHYRRTLFDGPDRPQDTDWAPQALVLFLGSNDFSDPFEPSAAWPDRAALQRAFVAGYAAFIASLRGQYPDALMILLASESYGEAYLEAHRSVLAAAKSAGVQRISLHVVPAMKRTGCHWHPSRADHAMLTDEILRAIDRHPDVWTGDAE